MPPHWTEYPERVETFGDLLSILETLDRHDMEAGFTAEDFQKARGRLTAYTVDFHNHQHQFHPRFDQMPGLEHLLDRFDIDGYPTLTQRQARELRRRAAKALNRDGVTVNAMTFTEIADALDAAECRAKSATTHRSQPGNPTPAPPTITPSRASLDEACQLTLAALRAARTLPIHRKHFNHENCTPTLRERCEVVGEQVRAARAAVPLLALAFRAVTRYVADRPFCNKFWSSAHEAAVEAANDLLWRFRPECGNPGETPEDRVYAVLESEVEKEHAAAVARFCAGQQETPTPPIPEQPTSGVAPDPIKTFGEFLQNVRAVEVCTARTRADGDSNKGCPSSKWYYVQADVFEATAQYKQHPSFPALEAYVNHRYGAFTHANLIRVRGEFCSTRHRTSAEADQLSVEEVVTALCCPGTPVAAEFVATPHANQVKTCPASVEPPHHHVEAAMRALPGVLNNAPAPSGVHDSAGRKGTGYAVLRQRLEAAPFNRDAVEWAIHRHVEAGRLEAAPGVTSTPGVYRDGGWAMTPVTNHTYDRERCVLWAQPALREWWNAIESGQPVNGVSMSTNPTTPPQQNPEGQPPAGYTMNDIRDLLRYKREMAAFEVWRRSTFKPVLKVEEVGLRAASMAWNNPQPGRLSEEVANTLAVYRRLLREALTVLNKELDESVLLYFVGEVADRHKQRVEEMWPLSTEVFGCMMDEPARPAAPTTPSAEVTPKATGNGTQEPAAPQQDRKLTDRQKLILTEMLAIGAIGNTKKTTRNDVVQRINKKKTGVDFARDFGALKEANHTDSDAGPDGGVWLTGKGKVKAEELRRENGQ